MTRSGRRINLPPLQRYEIPDVPATALLILPEKDTFSIPGEKATTTELREIAARPVMMQPLHPSEMPDTLIRVFHATVDPRLDEPEWGTAKRMPEIPVQKGRLLRPWDD